jgi:hypothetical protein
MRLTLSKKLDAGGDGVVDKTEMMATLQSGRKTAAVGNKGGSPGQVFAKIDTNNDGVISQSELDAALSKAQDSAGASLSGSTSSPVNDPAPANGAKGAAGSASGQTRAVNNVLKNYLAQCGQAAGQQQAGLGFTAVV